MQMYNSKYYDAFGYLRIGIQYLNLVEAVANETIQQGNNWVVVSDTKVSLEQHLLEIKWSDHMIIVPMLFSFYHGVETLLKGFILCKGKLKTKNHKLSGLLEEFKNSFPNHNLNNLLSRYIENNQLPEPLASFCSNPSISVDEFYQALKYPESIKGKKYRHTHLMYKSGSGLPFFYGLVSDIKQIRLNAVKLGQDIFGNDEDSVIKNTEAATRYES
jgi:hypothetical protein